MCFFLCAAEIPVVEDKHDSLLGNNIMSIVLFTTALTHHTWLVYL